MAQKARSLTEVAKEKGLYRPLVKVADILGKEIVIERFYTTEGDMGEYAVVEALLDGEPIRFSTGGMVLLPVLKGVEDELPLRTTIVREGRTLVFT